jgi:hypothetical protein
MFNIKLPPTAKRVARNTNPNINASIRNRTIRCINVHRNSNDEEISARLKKLNSEWDTERFLEANAAAIVVASTILGVKFNKKWFLVTGAVGLFLLQHAIQGWCPPLPIIRRMGVRTAEEINNEKTVLKMMRNDFSPIVCDSKAMLNIVEKQ